MKECPECHLCFDDDYNWCTQDRQPLSFLMSGPTVLDERYQLERKIGQGGMGVVFKANHIYINTAYAIKIILPELVGNNPKLASAFRHEAVLAASIHHPNVISVTDFGIFQGAMPFLVMKLIHGDSLAHLLQIEGKLTPEKAISLVEPICAGVDAAHALGIVHRDLKPQNIIVQHNAPYEEGVKVLDFGISKVRNDNHSSLLLRDKDSGFAGSPAYMAPEHWGAGKLTDKSDIYSIGIITYQLLTGVLPFQGNSVTDMRNSHLYDTPQNFASLGLNISPQIESVIRRALEKAPENRQQTVDEFSNELHDALHRSGANYFNRGPSSGEVTKVLPTDFLPQSRDFTPSSEDRIPTEPKQTQQELKELQLKYEEEAKKRVEEESILRRAEEEARKRAEEEAQRLELARKQAEEEAKRLALEVEEAKKQAKEEARKREEEIVKNREESELRRRAEEEARKKAEDEAKRLTLEVVEARKRAEEQSRKYAEEKARKQAEEIANRQVEELKRNIEAEAVKKRFEEESALRRAEEEARKRAEDNAKILAEARKRAEEEAKILAEARKHAEEEAKRLAYEVEQAKKLAQEESLKREEEIRRQAKEESLKREEEIRRQAKEEALKREEEIRRQAKEEAEARRLESEAQSTKIESLITVQTSDLEETTHSLANMETQTELPPTVILDPNYVPTEFSVATSNTILSKTTQDISLTDPDSLIKSDQSNNEQKNLFANYDLLGTSQLGERSTSFVILSSLLAISLLVILGIGIFVVYRLSQPKEVVINKNGKPQPQKPINKNLVEISGGEFLMGTNDINVDDNNEIPQYPAHKVSVESFMIDKTEVTNEEYAKFIIETNYEAPKEWDGKKPPVGKENYPVVNVSIQDANAFAVWRSKRDGLRCRLPSEMEWEYVARSGAKNYIYPWGNEWKDNMANVGTNSLTAVGSYPEGTAVGAVQDIMGNVYEWTSTIVSLYPNNTIANKKNYLIEGGSNQYVFRGGTFNTPVKYRGKLLTLRQWLPPTSKENVIGFRLVCNQ